MDKNIVALVREDTKTVIVKFFPERWKHFPAKECDLDACKPYKYVTTLDFKPGDLAFVFVQNVPVIVEIQEVHDFLDIEANAEFQYKFIAGKIDISYNEKLTEQNNEIQATLNDAYRSNTRRQFRDQFLAMTDDTTRNKLISITSKKEFT